MSRLILAALLLIAAFIAGCACAPLGPQTLPNGEDKYSAQYD